MRKGILFLWLVLFLFLSPFFLLSAPEQGETKFEKSEGLRREIRLINLLNGLELNSEQTDMILRRAEESRKVRQEFETTLLFQKGEMERVLEEIKKYLQDNREIPSSTIQRFHRLETEIKEARFKMEKRMKEMSQDVKKALSEHQVYQLQEFIPCIISPKGELRIGQVQDYKGLTKRMERIRQLPYRVYEKIEDEIVARTLKGMQLHVPRRAELDEKEMERHIRSVFEKVRSLKEAEFEIQKDKLAEELISPLRPQAFLGNFNLNRKIEAFLLTPEIIPILERRIRQPGTGSESPAMSDR